MQVSDFNNHVEGCYKAQKYKIKEERLSIYILYLKRSFNGS